MSKAPIQIEAQVYYNYVAGEWVRSESGKTYHTINPANKKQILGYFQESTREDAKRAIEAAHNAFLFWKDTPAPVRGEILFKAWTVMKERSEELARTMTLEEGKPLADARGEVKRSLNVLEFMAGEGRRLKGETVPSELKNNFAYTIKKPLGVIAVITPWNFPLAIAIWKISPALITGNTVVFKPASSTPLTAISLIKLFIDAGLPKAVLNMVTGPGETVGMELVENRLVEAISVTGHTETGALIYEKAARMMKKVQCEMGGKNAVVILEDADIDLAIEGIMQGAFGSTGQRCTSTSRIIVEEKVKDIFIKRLLERTKRLKITDGFTEGVDVSPLASESQFNKVMSYIETGQKEGATLLFGGKKPSGKEYEDGYYVEPTIFTDVKPDMRIAHEEIFGPVLPILTAKDFEEAIQIANSVRYGLSASIYTSDINKAFKFTDVIEVGMIHINSPTLGGEAQLPFGGIKASGLGIREQGSKAIEFFTDEIVVYVDYTGKRREARFI